MKITIIYDNEPKKIYTNVIEIEYTKPFGMKQIVITQDDGINPNEEHSLYMVHIIGFLITI